MRRPIQMQPMGNMQSRFKPQRVSSSTSPAGKAQQAGEIGLVNYGPDSDISAEQKFVGQVVENWSDADYGRYDLDELIDYFS